jgi:hypothetical protein
MPQAAPIRAVASILALGILASPGNAAQAQETNFAAPEAPKTAEGYGPDLIPQAEQARLMLMHTVAYDATIYGLSGFLQYEQLYRQVYDRTASNFTGFNRFYHERTLAGPAYQTFKVPNTDTLYSTAWIDLSKGPVEIDVPATDLKYFTLNIFDIWGNPSNLSSRTIGFKGGRFLVVPPKWKGSVPDGLTLYRANSVQLWILMRVFAQTQQELARARNFQAGVKVTPPTASPHAADAAPPPPKPNADAIGFLEALDFILRVNGPQPGEDALVSRFRILGVDAEKPFSAQGFDTATLAAIRSGYEDAKTMLYGSKSQLGMPTGTGWMRVDKGEYLHNYVRRSVINAAGLGANVREENASYTTFIDGSGKPLDAGSADYVLHLVTPPPVNAFWSATLYDAETFALYPNPLRRYLVSDRTKSLVVNKDGSIDIRIQHEKARGGNWLPAPSGKFFVVLRAYSPKDAMLKGDWLPPAIMSASGTGVGE